MNAEKGGGEWSEREQTVLKNEPDLKSWQMQQPSWYRHKSNKVPENQWHFRSQGQIPSQKLQQLAC